MRRLAVLSALLLGACATQPLPFAIERGGNLPLDRYPALERLAAATPPVVKVREGVPLVRRPEPFWVYSVDPGLQLARLPLQVGPFTGATARAGEVAGDLQKRLVGVLEASRLFTEVGTAPSPGGLVLTGTVTRATTEDTEDGQASAAMTQVEAKLTRDGAVVGVMQVNALQLESSAAAPLVFLLYSAVQGSRAGYVSTKFREMFEGIAASRAEGIDTNAMGNRFVRRPGP